MNEIFDLYLIRLNNELINFKLFTPNKLNDHPVVPTTNMFYCNFILKFNSGLFF